VPTVKTDRMQMSEARYNDLIYLLLKKLFFEPAELGGPRECDIRVCMQLAAPELLTGPQDAVLLPGEQSGRSHTRTIEVCFGTAFDECLTYLEEHWMKQTMEEAAGDPVVKQAMWDWCCQQDGIFDTVKTLPEEQCGGG
jgi:hypothetical protein